MRVTIWDGRQCSTRGAGPTTHLFHDIVCSGDIPTFLDNLLRLLQHLQHKLSQTLVPGIHEHLARFIAHAEYQLHHIVNIPRSFTDRHPGQGLVRLFRIRRDAPDPLDGLHRQPRQPSGTQQALSTLHRRDIHRKQQLDDVLVRTLSRRLVQRRSIPGKRVQQREDGEEIDFILDRGEIEREKHAVLVFETIECRLLDGCQLFIECFDVDLGNARGKPCRKGNTNACDVP